MYGILVYSYSVVIPSIGLVGNTFAFVVLISENIRKTTFGVFLATLAVMDFMFLAARIFEVQYHKADFQITSYFCKTRHVFTYTGMMSSSWLLVAVTIDRFVAICYPFQAKTYLKIATARCISVGIVIVFFLANCYGFWLWDVIGNRCNTFDPKIYLVAMRYVNILTTVFYAYIPFVVLSILNTIIVRTLRKHRIQKMKTAHHGKGAAETKAVTMILVATFWYLICTAPFCVIAALRIFSIIPPSVVSTLLDAGSQVLLMLNHSLNFFIYVFSGTNFRSEFKRVFRLDKIAGCISCKESEQDINVKTSTSRL